MDLDPKLQKLIRRIGLGDEEVAERRRFLDWQEEDVRCLNRTAPQIPEANHRFIDRLYEHLDEFAPTARILRNPATVERLKRSQRAYYDALWSGPYDADYVRNRLQVGLVHQQVGLDSRWYIGAYRLYLDEMLGEILGQGAAADVYRSLLKIVFFDMGLAIDTYNAAKNQALEESEARFARALLGSSEGIWDWDVDADRLYVSARWAEMLGCNRDSFGESSASWFSRVHPDDLPVLRQAIDDHLRGDSHSLDQEYRLLHSGGDYLWVRVRGVAAREHLGTLRMAGSQTDISMRKLAEHQLLHAARHDPLTGLANRTRLDELLQQAIRRRAKAGARHAALLFIDLDRFKLINDSLGHAVGDRVLVEVAQRLSRCLRPGDYLIRFGGDEFVVLLEDMARDEDAEHVAQRVLESLQPPLQLDGRTLVISASIGITSLTGESGDDALQAADLALYRAKAAGKSQFARFSDDLMAHAQRQLELGSALAMGLSQDAFVLHYQPVCSIEGEQMHITGVEALLRWRHEGRLVSPLEFIPILEEAGTIVAVGEWVLRETCRQTRAWQLAGHSELRCSVNLSSRQLQHHDFSARLAAILAETGLPAASLVLEITESLLMEDTADVLASVREIARLGVKLALDDFGTGYCSLGYLKRFPLYALKVDRSFISGAATDPELAVISRAIIGLGQNLGLAVIAEGVENLEQIEFLRAEGCNRAQGYWFSKPRPAEQIGRLLRGEDCFEGLVAVAAAAAGQQDRAL